MVSNAFKILGNPALLQQSYASLYTSVLKEKWFMNKMQQQQKMFPRSLLLSGNTPPSISPRLSLSERRAAGGE